jgi:hypothetical protein
MFKDETVVGEGKSKRALDVEALEGCENGLRGFFSEVVSGVEWTAGAKTPRLCAQGLEVIAHEVVQRALIGNPRLVPCRPSRHTAAWGEPPARLRSHETR